MIKRSNYSYGYNMVLKGDVSDGGIKGDVSDGGIYSYMCGACCYCDWRVDTPRVSHNNITHHRCIFRHQKQHLLKP
jgi:hypothetical protein